MRVPAYMESMIAIIDSYLVPHLEKMAQQDAEISHAIFSRCKALMLRIAICGALETELSLKKNFRDSFPDPDILRGIGVRLESLAFSIRRSFMDYGDDIAARIYARIEGEEDLIKVLSDEGIQKALNTLDEMASLLSIDMEKDLPEFIRQKEFLYRLADVKILADKVTVASYRDTRNNIITTYLPSNLGREFRNFYQVAQLVDSTRVYDDSGEYSAPFAPRDKRALKKMRIEDACAAIDYINRAVSIGKDMALHGINKAISYIKEKGGEENV